MKFVLEFPTELGIEAYSVDVLIGAPENIPAVLIEKIFELPYAKKYYYNRTYVSLSNPIIFKIIDIIPNGCVYKKFYEWFEMWTGQHSFEENGYCCDFRKNIYLKELYYNRGRLNKYALVNCSPIKYENEEFIIQPNRILYQ